MNNIFDTDDFTLYCLCNADSEADFLNPDKKIKKQYISRLLKEKIIRKLIKINIPFILYFSFNFQINDTITMYLFNHRVMYFTRYGKIVHKKKMSLEEFFGCKGGLCK